MFNTNTNCGIVNSLNIVSKNIEIVLPKMYGVPCASLWAQHPGIAGGFGAPPGSRAPFVCVLLEDIFFMMTIIFSLVGKYFSLVEFELL